MSIYQSSFPLRNIGIFLKYCRKRSYKAKGIIIHYGDRSNSLYYILSGSVAVVAEDSDGKEITLHTLTLVILSARWDYLMKILAALA